MESSVSYDLEERPRPFPQQYQKLPIVNLPIAVQVRLVDHLLHVHLTHRYRVRMDQVLDVVSVQFPVAVCIQLFELLPEETLIFGDGGVEERCDEFCVVYLSAVVEVHCYENLLDVCCVQIGVDLLTEVFQADHHFLLTYHAVSIDVQFHKDFSEVFYLLFRDLNGQVHEYGLLEAEQGMEYSFMVTSFFSPLKTSSGRLTSSVLLVVSRLTQGCSQALRAVQRLDGSLTSSLAIRSLAQLLHLWKGSRSSVQMPFLMLMSMAVTSLPQKGGRPHRRMQRMTPQAQLSTSFPYLPLITSGARYMVVPFGWFQNSFSLKILAIPKSINLMLWMLSFSLSRMFQGFRSRWQILW